MEEPSSKDPSSGQALRACDSLGDSAAGDDVLDAEKYAEMKVGFCNTTPITPSSMDYISKPLR